MLVGQLVQTQNEWSNCKFILKIYFIIDTIIKIGKPGELAVQGEAQCAHEDL